MILSFRFRPNTSHLDAVQGRAEERIELYINILRKSTVGSDAVMHQEPPVQPAWLAGRAAVRRVG